jgi:glucokinase
MLKKRFSFTNTKIIFFLPLHQRGLGGGQMTNETLAIGADIGGTHITAAIVDLDKRSIIPGSLSREKVDSHASPAEIVAVWSRAISKAKQATGISKVGLAIPGPFDYEEGICLIKDQGKYENLYGINMKALLSAELENKPEEIIMINDAASFLQGEWFGGAAIGFERAIGITLGTGLGTCVYEKHHASNADLWSLPFKQGIAEDYLSTRWFVRRYHEMTGNKVSGVRELRGLMESDNSIQKIFDEFATNLADFLAEFLAIAPADLIVIGGNIAKSYAYFKEALMKSMETKKLSKIEIRTALLGEEAALIGAASYWKK